MMNDDVILEIMSCCSANEIAKFRILNKTCNKRSYESFFINHHLHRTNSVLGYFTQYYKKLCYSRFVSRFVSSGMEEEDPRKTGISLDFLPSKEAKIEACDTHHGILLCVDDDKFRGGRRIPDYIVCKPATKQYRIIPNPKTRYFTILTGLMVIQSNPFRYKIIRVSEPRPWERRKMKEGFYNLNCEVFDSDTFAWKRLNDLELPWGEYLPGPGKLVSSDGFLHWLTTKTNVIRFCMRTETWSCFPVPEDVVGDDGSYLKLVSYEGKLGVIRLLDTDMTYGVWTRVNNNSWVNVKNVKITDPEDIHATRPFWFLSNDLVSVAGDGRLGVYNMNSSLLHMKTQNCLPHYLPRNVYFPYYSNFERICLNEDRASKSNGCG